MSASLSDSQCLTICAACGGVLECQANVTGAAEAAPCWCAEIKLSEAALVELEARFQGCLCKNCLLKFASSE